MTTLTRHGALGLTLTLLLGCSSGTDDETDGAGGADTGGTSSGGASTGGATNSGGRATGGVVEGSGGATGGSTTSAIGAACEDNSTCPPIGGVAGVCKLDWSGGYCTGQCIAKSDCDTYADCREEDGLLPAGAGMCLQQCGCETCSKCRDGFDCILAVCIPQ